MVSANRIRRVLRAVKAFATCCWWTADDCNRGAQR